MTLRSLVLAAALASVATANANMILNGDFENNTAGVDQTNLSNPSFTTLMADTTAYGFGAELDILTVGTPYGPDPQSNKWKVSLANGSTPDAFTFHLSSGIVQGQTYRLSFWATRNQDFSAGDAALFIGVSGTDTSFGSTVYTTGGGVAVAQWQNFSTSFVAPVNGSFLSVEIGASNGTTTWMHVDNFRMEAVPEPSTVVGMALGAAGILAARRRRK